MLVATWLAAWVGSTPAHGFCGTYVGPAGEELTNDSSVVVLAQNSDGTVLTMANDFQGTTSDFGLLVPVPAGFSASSVSVVDGNVFDALDVLTGPRVVSYTCADLL